MSSTEFPRAYPVIKNDNVTSSNNSNEPSDSVPLVTHTAISVLNTETKENTEIDTGKLRCYRNLTFTIGCLSILAFVVVWYWGLTEWSISVFGNKHQDRDSAHWGRTGLAAIPTIPTGIGSFAAANHYDKQIKEIEQRKKQDHADSK